MVRSFSRSHFVFRDWRKSGLTEYVCPGEVDPDIDDLAVYLNTTYYPVDVDFQESNDPQDDLYIYNLTLDQPKSGYITYFIAGEVDSDKGTIYFTTQARFIKPYLDPQVGRHLCTAPGEIRTK